VSRTSYGRHQDGIGKRPAGVYGKTSGPRLGPGQISLEPLLGGLLPWALAKEMTSAVQAHQGVELAGRGPLPASLPGHDIEAVQR
jgi:hypothetical protein